MDLGMWRMKTTIERGGWEKKAIPEGRMHARARPSFKSRKRESGLSRSVYIIMTVINIDIYACTVTRLVLAVKGTRSM